MFLDAGCTMLYCYCLSSVDFFSQNQHLLITQVGFRDGSLRSKLIQDANRRREVEVGQIGYLESRAVSMEDLQELDRRTRAVIAQKAQKGKHNS